jgi:MFS family permease
MRRTEHSNEEPVPRGTSAPLAPLAGRSAAQQRQPPAPSGPLAGQTFASQADRGEREPDVPAERNRGYRTVLSNRYFLRLWMAQLISQTIMNATNYGLIILIATQSKSVTLTGGAIVAFSLPAALFGAPAGVLVDRFDKRRLLWLSNALRALATLGFVITLYIDGRALVPVYLLTFLIAMIGQFFAPAEGAAIPLLVHEDELVNALALFNITFTLSQVAGLIVLGPLILAALPVIPVGVFFHHRIDVTQLQSLFLIVVILYLVCALLIAAIPRARLMNRTTHMSGRPLAHEGERLRGIWAGITECWTFIRHDRTLFAAVMQLSLAGTVIAVIAELAPSFVVAFFHLDAHFAALVFIPAGAGLILGSAVLPQAIRRVRHTSRLVMAGVVTLSGSALMLTFVHSVATHVRPYTWWLSWTYIGAILLLTFIMGIGLDLINIPAQTVMQERSPDWIKGRVLALQGMLFNAATVPAVFLIGLVADYWGLPLALNALALSVALIGLLTVLYAMSKRAMVVSTIPGVTTTAAGRLAHQSTSGPINMRRLPRSDGPHSRPVSSRVADPVE